jgi:hypothetical protein
MGEMSRNCIEMTQTLHFRLRPGMSALPNEWKQTDAYWAPAALATAPATAKK